MHEIAPGQYVCRPGMECSPGSGVLQGQSNYGMQQQPMGLDMGLGGGGLNYGVPSMNSFGGMNNSLNGGLGGGHFGGLGGGNFGGQMNAPIHAMSGGLIGGMQFGGKIPQVNTKQFCCIHKKERKIDSLVAVAPGAKGLRCRPDDECKLGQSQLEQVNDMVECSIHGKKRSTNWLECQEDGSWRCKEESECISTVGAEKQPCSQHGKHRATEVMQQDSSGNWTCKPGSKCKGSNLARQPGVPYARPTTGGGSVCALHNKKRGSKYLVPHPSIAGCSTCVPGNECK